MRLNFRHRRYLANYFIKDKLDGRSYDVWAIRSSVINKYSKELRELILQCMDLVVGEGFSERFKKNEGLIKHMWSGTSIDPEAIGITWDTVVEFMKRNIKIPKPRFSGWELTKDNVGRYTPNINLHSMGPIPDIQEFYKNYDLIFPKSVWDSKPFREIQNIYLKTCVDYCSSPLELVDYFCGSDWDEFRLDLRTFLIPQGIKTTEDLRREYSKYYEICASEFRRELC